MSMTEISPSTAVAITSPPDPYQGLVKHGRELIRLGEHINWKLGELAAAVDKDYGQDRLGQFAEDIGIDKKVLMGCRTTFKAWPEKKLQKSKRPDFSIATILNPHPQRFQIVAKNPDITVPEARGRMKAFNQREADKKAIEQAAELGGTAAIEADDNQQIATRHLAKIVKDSMEMAIQGKRYLSNAKLDKALMDALADTVKAWKELLDQAATTSEEQS